MSLVEYLHETNKEKRAILNTFLSPQFGYFLHAWMKHVRVLTKERKNITRREKCPYSEFFWSVFSRIRIEYGEIQNSIQMRGNTDEKNSEYEHFSHSEKT